MTRTKQVWRRLSLVVIGVVSSLALMVVVTATPVQAASMTMCQPAPTLVSLHACVQHAAHVGGITSSWVTRSLLAKVRMAQDAVEDHHDGAAIATLERFIHEVRTQTGKHIQSDHANHLIMHAQMVIQALATAQRR